MRRTRLPSSPQMMEPGRNTDEFINCMEIQRSDLTRFAPPTVLHCDVSEWSPVLVPGNHGQDNDRDIPIRHIDVSLTRHIQCYGSVGAGSITAYRQFHELMLYSDEGFSGRIDVPRNYDCQDKLPISVLDALVFLLSGWGRYYDIRDERDILSALRGMSSSDISSLAHWMPNRTREGESLRTVIERWRRDVQDAREGRGTSFPIGHMAGSGSVSRVFEAEDEKCGIVLRDGTVIFDVNFNELRNAEIISRDGDAWKCVRIASRMTYHAMQSLKRVAPEDDLFAGLSSEVIDKIYKITKGTTIGTAETWLKVLKASSTFDTSSVVAAYGFPTGRMDFPPIMGVSWFGTAPIYEMLRNESELSMSGIDITEFQRTELPSNELVASLEMLPHGTVRVVLKEFVYPVAIQWRGRIYAEDECGTVLSNMGVMAFDLHIGQTTSRFPEVKAYADAECNLPARHTNISADGRVCLGDINAVAVTDEERQRRGLAIPTLGDFLQMLRMCNLDSAYNGGKNFVLLNPNSVTDEQWRESPWRIPGLHLVDLDLGV